MGFSMHEVGVGLWVEPNRPLGAETPVGQDTIAKQLIQVLVSNEQPEVSEGPTGAAEG